MNAIAMPRLSSGTVEAVKWIALAAMVVDHVNAVFYARELGLVADAIGRIAMPLFAIVFGYNLARPGVEVGKALRRLLAFGLLAMPAHVALFGYIGPWPGNILLTFAVAAWVILEFEAGRTWTAAVAFVGGGALVEYWWPGVGLVVAVWMLASARRFPWAFLPAVAVSLGALCWLVNGNAWALLSVPLVAAIAYIDPTVPRLRWWFWWFYPVHLSAFWIWNEVGKSQLLSF